MNENLFSPIKKENLFQEKLLNDKGLMGKWLRFFKKITGKKSLTQKAGIDVSKNNN